MGNINNQLIIHAVYNNHEPLVRELLARGADLNIKNAAGNMALDYAIEKNLTTIRPLLIEKGAKATYSVAKFTNAIKTGQLDALKYLYAIDVNVNTADKAGDTFLIHAVAAGHEPVVRFLIEKGATVNELNKSGISALYLAVEKGFLPIVKLLIEKGADVNAADKNKKSPLHIAAEKGFSDIAKLLLEKGARKDLADGGGNYPSTLARRGGFNDLALSIESYKSLPK